MKKVYALAFLLPFFLVSCDDKKLSSAIEKLTETEVDSSQLSPFVKCALNDSWHIEANNDWYATLSNYANTLTIIYEIGSESLTLRSGMDDIDLNSEEKIAFRRLTKNVIESHKVNIKANLKEKLYPNCR